MDTPLDRIEIVRERRRNDAADIGVACRRIVRALHFVMQGRSLRIDMGDLVAATEDVLAAVIDPMLAGSAERVGQRALPVISGRSRLTPDHRDAFIAMMTEAVGRAGFCGQQNGYESSAAA